MTIHHERPLTSSHHTLDRDTSLMYEIGSLRHVDRTWRHFGGYPFANVAEHSFRVAWLAWTIAIHEGADCGRVVQIALVHDTAETRTGDVNYLSRMYTDRKEDLALDDQYAGTVVFGNVRELWDEYEARETLESRIVKDADTLDCDFELNESATNGCTLNTALADTRIAAHDRLYTETARLMATRICAVDPHSWHVHGRNRHTGRRLEDHRRSRRFILSREPPRCATQSRRMRSTTTGRARAGPSGPLPSPTRGFAPTVGEQ